MATNKVQPITLKLDIKGGEQIAKLKSSFRDLTKTVGQTDSGIEAARKSINEYVKTSNQSEAVIKGQVKAFESLREQAAMGGKVYGDLSRDINKLQSTLRGSSDAVERKRESLVRLGAASKGSADKIRLAVGQLEKLKSKVREDSAAFSQLNKDISRLNATLKEIETSAGKAKFAINTILSAKPEKITGQIEKLSAAIANGKIEAEDLNAALRKLELLKVGAGRSPTAFRADVFSSELGIDYFAKLRKEYDNLEKTQATITQRISEVNTELRNVTGYERRRALTLELIRLNKELQQSIVDVTTREQLQAMAIRQRMGKSRETYAASGFGAFSADIRRRTAAGEFTPGMQRARERARNEIVDEEAVKATVGIFDTWEQAYNRIEDAARRHKVEMARIQAAQGELLIEKQGRINDQLLRSNQAANDKELAAFDARLSRIEKLKSGEYVSRRALGLGGGDLSSLYGNIVGIGTSYSRGQQEMMGRSPIQVFNDITSTFNRDLRRSGDARIEAERKLRDSLVREFGDGSQRLKAALERIPVGKMTTAQLPGSGEDLSAYVKRIEASTRGLEGSLTGFGKKTTNELRQARQALVFFRDELDPTTASFKRLEKESIASIERIDKELERRQRRRRMSGMQMTQAAGAVLSGGIFGGPEGFLGGAIGALGGVGGAFAGAAIGAQVGGIRRTLGEYAGYAAQIARLQIALEGISGSQDQYNRALAAAADVTSSLNLPQEVAIQGMTRLTAAVKGAGGGVADAELAFKNINSAIIATGGGAEQVQGAVTALVQIFSKGKVSAEEINQIAERLPGTFNKIAAASGRTGPELTKALQDGKVGLNDLMKFLVSLGDEYGELAEKIAGSSENAGARLQIAYNNMRIEVGDALQPIGAEFQDAFTEFIEDITPALVASLPVIARAFADLAKALMGLSELISSAFGGMFGEIQRQGEKSSGRIKGLFESVGDFFSQVAKFMSKTWQFRLGEIVVNASGGNAQIKKIIKTLGDSWKATIDFMGNYWRSFVEYAVNTLAGMVAGPVQVVLQKLGINLGKIVAAAVPQFGGGPSAQVPTDDGPALPKALTDYPDPAGGSGKGAGGDGSRQAELGERLLRKKREELELLLVQDPLEKELLRIKYKQADAMEQAKNAAADQREELEGLIRNVASAEAGFAIGESMANSINQFSDALNTVRDGFAEGAKIDEELRKANEEADIFKQTMESVGEILGTTMIDAIGGLIDGTAQLNDTLSDVLKQVGSLLLNAGLNALAGPVGSGGILSFLGFGFANGGYFDGDVAEFAKGGIVSSPTPFRFSDNGAIRTGLMGEAEPEAILPLKRGADGKLGVKASVDTRAALAEQTATMGAQTAPLDIRFESTSINGVEYVTAEQHRKGMAQAAEHGRALTLQALQNSVKSRRMVGLA